MPKTISGRGSQARWTTPDVVTPRDVDRALSPRASQLTERASCKQFPARRDIGTVDNTECDAPPAVAVSRRFAVLLRHSRKVVKRPAGNGVISYRGPPFEDEDDDEYENEAARAAGLIIRRS